MANIANTNTNLSANTNTLSQNDIELIKKQLFTSIPNAGDTDVEYCLTVAKQYGLNPINKEIFFVSRKTNTGGTSITKIEPLVGRDGFLSIAHRSGKFGGIKTKSELREIPKLINGKWQKVEDLVAICEVFRTDTNTPFVVEVSHSEYTQNNSIWLNKPDTMIKKVAESQALRKAFNINGLYCVDEMQVEDGVIVDSIAEEKTDNDIELELALLESYGIEAVTKNGWVRVVGNTHNKESLLKDAGYTLQEGSDGKMSWVKKVL